MICVAGMLAVVLSLTGAGWYSNQKLGDDLKQATDAGAARAIFAGQLRGEVIAMREKQRGVLMYALARDPKRADSNRTEFREHLREAKAAMSGALKLSISEKGKALLASIDADIDKYSGYFEHASTLISSGRLMAAVAVYRDQGGPIGTHMEESTQQYIDLQKEQFAAVSSASIAQIAAARWTSLSLVVIGLAVVGLITLVVRKITSQLRAITSSLSDGHPVSSI